MGRRQTPIARWSIHATGLAGSSRAPTSRISLSSRLMTIPFCIRRRCSRAPFLLRGVRPRGRRTAEQRDEQQPPGWSGERYVHSHWSCRRGSASWQNNHRRRRCWNWLSELSASALGRPILDGPTEARPPIPQPRVVRFISVQAQAMQRQRLTMRLEAAGRPVRHRLTHHPKLAIADGALIAGVLDRRAIGQFAPAQPL